MGGGGTASGKADPAGTGVAQGDRRRTDRWQEDFDVAAGDQLASVSVDNVARESLLAG